MCNVTQSNILHKTIHDASWLSKFLYHISWMVNSILN